ncbi:hypothetical protein Taro_027325 [Colocasia esculenta]|uniref:Uncharacterized protein n=1 Tax=Colocasia esculenta TaxID=4460 RepID=A0A843VJT6_COLES|nr:hypothetical protein [Colocasia esculenta]
MTDSVAALVPECETAHTAWTALARALASHSGARVLQLPLSCSLFVAVPPLSLSICKRSRALLIVKCRFGPEMKQNLLQFSWSWRPGVVVDLLASRYVVVDCMNLAAQDVDFLVPVFLKLLTGTEGWLEDRGTCGVAELLEEMPYRGAIPVGAREGLGVNREIAGGFSVF